ncbi:MAG: hypothetical protein ACFB10_06395 [Salibacteraceae bacterium]
MKRTILRISSILFASLSIWLFYDLLQPIKTTTYALNEEIILLPDTKKDFQTDFDYNYGIDITVEGESNFERIERIEIQIEGGDEGLIKRLSGEVDKSGSAIRLGNFSASRGSKYKFVVSDLSSGLKGKSALLKIDVTGGGPSIGIALAKELKPYFWGMALIFGFIALITGYFGFRKQQVINA